MHDAHTIETHLRNIASPEVARISQRFFKTGPGQYGEGDLFLGIKTPVLRSLVKTYRGTELTDISTLLSSKLHEVRSFALLLLIDFYQRGDSKVRQEAYSLYLSHTAHINNWDLVDISAPHIVGAHLADKSRDILYRLVQSVSLWERRIAIIATFHFIRQHDFIDTLTLAELLLKDEHDLMHKAVGWMLREIGKRNLIAEEKFLQRHTTVMPRTMLRYAIEKFPEEKRRHYLLMK